MIFESLRFRVKPKIWNSVEQDSFEYFCHPVWIHIFGLVRSNFRFWFVCPCPPSFSFGQHPPSNSYSTIYYVTHVTYQLNTLFRYYLTDTMREWEGRTATANYLGSVVEVGELYGLNIEWKWTVSSSTKSGVDSSDGRSRRGEVSAMAEVWTDRV